MDYPTQFLFFFSSLGVFNGFIMALYFLFFAKPKRIQNQFFGLLLLMVSIRIGKSVLHFFDPNLSYHVLQFGLTACAFIGPLLFFYLKSVLDQQKKIQKQAKIQLIGILTLVGGVGLIFPYAKRPDLWRPEIVQGIYAIWMAYVIASAFLLKKEFVQLFVNPQKVSTREWWLLIVFGTNALICLVFHSVLYVGFPSYILGPLSFSLVFYLLLGFLLFFPKTRALIEGEPMRYAGKKIHPNHAEKLQQKLHTLMVEERLFEQPELKLKDVADALSISPHQLSQLLNDNLSQSFTDFVNGYRVEAAGKLLRSENLFTVEAIGTEVGFRSKSTFYSAFKKYHGMTPAQFSKQANMG